MCRGQIDSYRNATGIEFGVSGFLGVHFAITIIFGNDMFALVFCPEIGILFCDKLVQKPKNETGEKLVCVV